MQTVDDERWVETGSDDARSKAASLRRFALGLSIIAAVALAIRVYWVLVGYSHYKVAGDALYFHWQSWAVADGHGFVNPFTFETTGQITPMAAHPPLYTLYLAFFSKLGLVTVTQHRLVSCLLGTGAVLLIGIAGRSIVNARVGLIAAAIAALYPSLWINDGMLLSEPMTALLMPLVLLTAYRLWRAPQMLNALWLGLALGATALNRGEAALLAAFVVLPLLIGMRSVAIRQRVALLATVALTMIVLVAPWVGYNLRRFEEPTFLTDHTGAVLRAASCDRAYYGEFAGWYFCPIPAFPGDASEQDARLLAEARGYTRSHLGRLPTVALIRVGRLWDVYNVRQTIDLNANVEGRTKTATQLAVLSFWLLAPFAIAGLIVLRRRGEPISPFLAPIIVVTIAAATTYGVARYRVSAEPGIVLAAAVSIDALWRRLARRRLQSDTAPIPT